MNTWCLLISLDTTKEPLLLWWILYYQWWWWSFPQVRGFWENDNSFPACACFFKVEIRSHTVIPLFRPGSVHSGSASWDKCGRVFPDELRVSSFSDRFQRHSQPTLTSRLPRMHKLIHLCWECGDTVYLVAPRFEPGIGQNIWALFPLLGQNSVFLTSAFSVNSTAFSPKPL